MICRFSCRKRSRSNRPSGFERKLPESGSSPFRFAIIVSKKIRLCGWNPAKWSRPSKSPEFSANRRNGALPPTLAGNLQVIFGEFLLRFVIYWQPGGEFKKKNHFYNPLLNKYL